MKRHRNEILPAPVRVSRNFHCCCLNTISFLLPICILQIVPELSFADKLKLLDGDIIEYEQLKITKDGLLAIHKKGAARYKWSEIDPSALPEDIRNQQRKKVLKNLRQAQTYWQGGNWEDASARFKEWSAFEAYLTEADKSKDFYKDIENKKKGLVSHEGKWILIAEKRRIEQQASAASPTPSGASPSIAPSADSGGEVPPQMQKFIDSVKKFGLVIPVVLVIWIVLFLGGIWKIFSKADLPGWAVFIPFVNGYLYVKAAGKPWYWFLLLFIPIINILIMILLPFSLSERFGKGFLFGLGIFFFPAIFLPILGWGKAEVVNGN